MCKLLVALSEHSIDHIASHLSTPRVQSFIRLLFTYTALPGYYGIDEEESEMTLSFWYLLQEALWNVDYGDDDAAESALTDWAESVQGKQDSRQASEEPKSNPGVATPIYAELVQVLKRKVSWPGKAELATWTKGRYLFFSEYPES